MRLYPVDWEPEWVAQVEDYLQETEPDCSTNQIRRAVAVADVLADRILEDDDRILEDDGCGI